MLSFTVLKCNIRFQAQLPNILKPYKLLQTYYSANLIVFDCFKLQPTKLLKTWFSVKADFLLTRSNSYINKNRVAHRSYHMLYWKKIFHSSEKKNTQNTKSNKLHFWILVVEDTKYLKEVLLPLPWGKVVGVTSFCRPTNLTFL